MKYRVRVSDEAEDDFVSIVEYVVAHSGLDDALDVQAKIEDALSSLPELAHRGRVVPSLRRIGVMALCEVIIPPWQILYAIRQREVHVVAIIDGRRSADDLIRERVARLIIEDSMARQAKGKD